MRDTLSIEAYRDELLRLVDPLVCAERVPVAQAAGRVLAEAVAAKVAIPTFDNSAMDGFAMRLPDHRLGAQLRVVGVVVAGSAADPAIAPGECVRIMTGAALPSDAEAVVPVELTETGDGVMQIVADPGGRTHVRRAGEDVAVGDLVLPAGAQLEARSVSLAISSGSVELVVRRRPRVAVVATGDELRGPGEPLGRGQIYESNAVYLAAQLRALGAEIASSDVLPDDPVAFSAGLDRAAAGADLVVLSGGVSVGDHDVVRQVLLGELGLTRAVTARFVHVVMQPGKPQGWALWPTADGPVPLVALPGNPLSTQVSCELFVEPMIDRLLGREHRPWLRAVVGRPWPAPNGRRQVVPVVAESREGVLTVRPAHDGIAGSHLISAAARADGLAVLDEPTGKVPAGAMVSYRRFL